MEPSKLSVAHICVVLWWCGYEVCIAVWYTNRRYTILLWYNATVVYHRKLATSMWSSCKAAIKADCLAALFRLWAFQCRTRTWVLFCACLWYGLQYVVDVLVGLKVGHLIHQLMLHGHEMVCRAYILHGHLTLVCDCSCDWNLLLSVLCLFSGCDACVCNRTLGGGNGERCCCRMSVLLPTWFHSPEARRFFYGVVSSYICHCLIGWDNDLSLFAGPGIRLIPAPVVYMI